MCSCLSKNLEKQGIVSILGSDHDCYERTINKANVTSMRRTLSSTDMSSKKWQFGQHEFSPMKKIASSEDLSLTFVDANKEKEDYGHQEGKKEQFDTWSSIIMSQKANNDKDTSEELPPYVHPLVKRSSTSSLSEKSLEICTENLGSETGSDGFSSYPASETSTDNESDQKEEHQQQEEKILTQSLFDIGDHQDQYCTTTTTTREVVKYNYGDSNKNLSPKSFPPPLQTLSQSDGASIQMRTHRDNGRLVLQAESVPLLKKNFSAQRQTGRLVLTFVDNDITHHEPEELNLIQEAVEKKKIDVDEFDEDFGEEDGEREREIGDEEEEEENEVEKVVKENRSREIDMVIMDQRPKTTPTRLTSVHRLALKVNMPIRLSNRLNNYKFNEVVKFDQGLKKEVVVVEPTSLPKSLPPRPPVGWQASSTPGVAKAAAAASFNAYEYYWRKNKSTQYVSKDKGNHKLSVSNDQIMVNNQQQQMVVYRGHKDEYFVPLIKGCKEQRRSLLWEPYCVATS